MTADEEIVEIPCSEVLRALADYLEEGVTTDLEGRIERQLLNCRGCRAIFDSEEWSAW